MVLYPTIYFFCSTSFIIRFFCALSPYNFTHSIGNYNDDIILLLDTSLSYVTFSTWILHVLFVYSLVLIIFRVVIFNLYFR